MRRPPPGFRCMRPFLRLTLTICPVCLSAHLADPNYIAAVAGETDGIGFVPADGRTPGAGLRNAHRDQGHHRADGRHPHPARVSGGGDACHQRVQPLQLCAATRCPPCRRSYKSRNWPSRPGGTTMPDSGHKVYPYLLRGLEIDKVNQVWAAC